MQAAMAIADPVRRQILDLLRDRPLPAGVIARSFPISRPAISRHLRVLRECGLVHDDLVGRERLYRVDPAPLAEITRWIALFGRSGLWEHRLDALETEVVRTRRHRRRSTDDQETA